MINKKPIFLKALKESIGIILYACEAVHIHRSTFYRWLEKDKKFQDEYKCVMEAQVDYVEHTLLQAMKNQQHPQSAVAALKIYLNAKGGDRGYGERVENEHSGTINFNVTRTIINDNDRS